MKEEEYLKNRLDDQIQWYSKKSQYNKKWFSYLRLLEICSAAMIPFLSGVMHADEMHYKWIIGGLGVLIALAAAVIALFQYQENWVEFRTTAEQLKHERYLYVTNTTPYNNMESKFQLIVERVEALISKENSKWAAMARECNQQSNE
jgi:hypothetical protein